MNKRFSISIVFLLILFLSLLGLLITAGHYAPQPSLEIVVSNSIAPGEAWFGQQRLLYEKYSINTLSHIVSAFLLMLLAPMQLIAKIRRQVPVVHRVIGRIFVFLAIISAVSGLIMSIVMPFGGINETIVIVFIFVAFIVFLALGLVNIYKKNIDLHRFWMTYMLAMIYSPIVMRLFYIVGIEFYNLDPKSIFAACLLLGAVCNLLVCRYWLRYSSSKRAKLSASSSNQSFDRLVSKEKFGIKN